METHNVLIKFATSSITVTDVITQLKITGAFGNATNQLIEIEVIRQEIGARGIVVTDTEKRDNLTAKRQSMGLSGAMEFSDYCHSNGIHPDQWKHVVEGSLLRKRLMQEMAASEDMAVYFQQNMERLKRVCIARIICKDRVEADRLQSIIIADNEKFSPLARQHSMEHNSRIAGGHVGCIGRGVLPIEIEQDLFSSKVGAIKGPYSQNGYWAIYLVEEVLHSKLTDTTRNHISGQLFTEWLNKKVLEVQNREINQENQYG